MLHAGVTVTETDQNEQNVTCWCYCYRDRSKWENCYMLVLLLQRQIEVSKVLHAGVTVTETDRGEQSVTCWCYCYRDRSRWAKWCRGTCRCCWIWTWNHRQKLTARCSLRWSVSFLCCVLNTSPSHVGNSGLFAWVQWQQPGEIVPPSHTNLCCHFFSYSVWVGGWCFVCLLARSQVVCVCGWVSV